MAQLERWAEKMSVEETRSVDFIRLADNPPRARLTIVDHLLWSDPRHLRLLEDKINAYFDFTNSGEFFDQYSEVRDLPLWFDVQYVHSPSDEALQFLTKLKELAAKEGVEFSWEAIRLPEEPNQTARDNARDVT